MNFHYWLASMRARADHGRPSMIRLRKAFVHKLRSHHHFGELLSLGSIRLHRPTWLSIAAYHDVFSTASTHCACLRDGFLLVPRQTFKFLQQLINIHDRSCLPIAAAADIHYRFCSLRSPGRGCIPMVNARFPPLTFCLHDCCLLVPRLTALQSFSVSSLGPSHPSTSEIHNSWSGITFILFSISCFTCDSLHFHTIFIPPGLIFTPPRAHRPAAVSHPSRKTDSPPNQDPSMIHSPPALPITNSSRLRFIHRERLFIHSQSNC